MSDKVVASEQENLARGTKGGKFKRHCRRFWWAHLIVFVAITLLVALLM